MTVPGWICVVMRRWTRVSLVRSGTRKSSTFCDPRSTTPNTHGPSDTLPRLNYFLLAPNVDSSISTVFPKPPILIPAFRTLLEQIVLSSPSARTTVGFERLVSRAILLPEIWIAQRNIRCSQELNVILDPSKKDPDLIESHVRHRLFVQRHMYPSFTHVVSVSSILQPHLEHCWQLAKSFCLTQKLKIFWKVPSITKRSLNSMSYKVVIEYRFS